MMTQPILPIKPNELKEKDHPTSGRIEIFHEILRRLGICDSELKLGMGLSSFDYCNKIKNNNPFATLVLQALKASTQETYFNKQNIVSGDHYLWMIDRFPRHFISKLKGLKVMEQN